MAKYKEVRRSKAEFCKPESRHLLRHERIWFDNGVIVVVCYIEESWYRRAYIPVEGTTKKQRRDMADDWVSACGMGYPGGPFAREPHYRRCKGYIIVGQSGGLDI